MKYGLSLHATSLFEYKHRLRKPDKSAVSVDGALLHDPERSASMSSLATPDILGWLNQSLLIFDSSERSDAINSIA